MRRAATGCAALFFLTGSLDCSSPMQGGPTTSTRPAAPGLSEHCQMALTALNTTVKKFEEQPLGLNRGCVERVASFGGRIYVDARFTKGDRLELSPESSCTTERYMIRLDPTNFVPSPAEEVVLLGLWTNPAGEWEFNAVVEVSNWPSRRPETMSLSQCGSAFGVLRRSSQGWNATIIVPPRSPDAL
jgi:hypothetical protein